MTNRSYVCLVFVALLFILSPSSARQVPKECAKGPTYWCQLLKTAADCGAVGHCSATVWSKNEIDVSHNEVSDKFIHLFRQLRDVKDLINEEYLASTLQSACHDIPYPAAVKICRENTVKLETYIQHALSADLTAETLCSVVGMCNNMKLDNIISLSKKKNENVNKDKETQKPNQKLLGASQCTWGPSYWCSNISTGHECKATKHCIERVWSQMQVEEDNDSVCKICLDMVTQARDQLQSNETEEELKEVFEGSCNLIPIKVVAKECRMMVDNFIPDLVETLASQMNPQVVCSVAGLCNNAHIDEMLLKYKDALKAREECSNCKKTVVVLRKNFDETSYEDFLISLLQVCRKTGSLSDSCSMLVFKYYENILAAVKKDLEPRGVCHLSGQCSYLYHNHNEVTLEDDKSLRTTDDVPCEFCEDVLNHLRNMLVANTTETEFYRVLKGICKQTGNFKDECLQLVEQYYPVVYQYLVSDLNAKELCALGGICPSNVDIDVPIAPLVPEELVIKAMPISTKLIGTDEANSKKIRKVETKQSNVKIMGTEAPLAPLPIERMFVKLPATAAESKSVCTFCEYFLHYVQVELSDTNTEDAIKNVVDKACEKLPKSVGDECKMFVADYGPAVVALLVQEIDPSSVCPALGLCPSVKEVQKVSINSDHSNCPLCLFAVLQLETVLKNNRTEASIRTALDHLCNHLSAKLRTECVDFVDTYTDQLVEMLIADFNAQEICTFLKLCKDTTEKVNPMQLSHSSIDQFFEKPNLLVDRNKLKKHKPDSYADIETNEIPDNTVNGRPVEKAGPKTVCVVCEFVLKEIDDEIKDKGNEDEIKKIVHGVCKRMPKSVRGECDQFVEKYADLVISLLAQELEPEEVCQELKLCDPTAMTKADNVKESILDCAVCEAVAVAVKKVISNDKTEHNVVHIVEKACNLLPAKYYDRCHTLMEIYGDSVIHLVLDLGSKELCHKIGLCNVRTGAYVQMYQGN